jgi:hypothetical protein
MRFITCATKPARSFARLSRGIGARRAGAGAPRDATGVGAGDGVADVLLHATATTTAVATRMTVKRLFFIAFLVVDAVWQMIVEYSAS